MQHEKHEKFHYKTLNDLKQKLNELGLDIPLSDHFEAMFEPFEMCGKTINNKVVYQPMEGCDSKADGSPGELTMRKYKRFAGGGPGIIWFEAVALVPEGRAQARQLFMRQDNLDGFKRCLETMKESCLKRNGFEPMVIMQLTHSGRNSRPNGFPQPIVAYNNPLFESGVKLSEGHIITDSRLDELKDIFLEGAKMAEVAGFDGCDIKACHGYLVNELLSAYIRQGNYGGTFENRVKFLCDTVHLVREEMRKDFVVSTRLSLYDGFPYPYGFGVAKNGGVKVDLSGPLMLINKLREESGLEVLNTTMGNPYVNPHINRPYDTGAYVPDEHPLVGVHRILSNTKTVQKKNVSLKVISSGFSYLRSFAPYAASGMLESGNASLVGFGREALAYPDFLQDLKNTGKVDNAKVCLSCGNCALLLRSGKESGCMVRDSEKYGNGKCK